MIKQKQKSYYDFCFLVCTSFIYYYIIIIKYYQKWCEKMKKRGLVFPEDEAYDTVIQYFEKQGITLKDIAEIAFEQQKPYHVPYNVDDYEQMVDDVLQDADVLGVALTMIQLDKDSNEGKLIQPLQDIIENDTPVYAVDETLALAIAGHYSPVGITQFGSLDVHKLGVAKKLDEDTKRYHVFLDDLISALAAAVCGMVLKLIS